MRYYKTFKDYRKAWNNAFNEDPKIPLNIDIELSSVCNLKCPFCFVHDKSYNSKSRPYIDILLAKQIINNAAKIGVPALKFNWRGEPTLHPQFTNIIKYAKHKNKFYELIVNTNGNIPDDSLDGLFYCTKVIVSLDSLNNETYKKCRKNGSLNQVKGIISLLIEKGHRNIWVRRVINEHNKSENFIADVRKIWGNKVKASEHYCFDRNKDNKLQIAENSNQIDRQYCGYPSQRLTITTEGKVYPCCVDYQQTIPIGDITKSTIQEIWNEPRLSFIRNMLRQNIIPKENACADCTSFMAYKAKEREFINDRDR